jgi:cytochrome bd ubiquinol oxidase subunit I
VAAIHAARLRRDPTNLFDRRALAIALAVGGVSAVLQPASGHLSAQMVARHQPVKFAAMEAHFDTQRGAPILVGGWADEEREETRYALKIPYLLSILAFDDPHAEVKGLKEFPRADRPPVAIVHIAFDVMVGCGTVLAGVSVLVGFLAWRKRGLPDAPWLMRILTWCGPLGFIALEAGWVVTEVGRQPWIIYGVMRTADAVTPMPYLLVPFVTFGLLYVFLGVVVVYLLRRQVMAAPQVMPSGGVRPGGEH